MIIECFEEENMKEIEKNLIILENISHDRLFIGH